MAGPQLGKAWRGATWEEVVRVKGHGFRQQNLIDNIAFWGEGEKTDLKTLALEVSELDPLSWVYT